jgi:phospholipid-binding lipoprotein MlaA
MQLWRENSRVGRTGAALLLVALLGACASSVPEDQRSESDPWETLNRSIYSFNTNVDKATLKPLAKGYEKVIPNPVRRGISNFFRNLGTPASSVNNFLQGKPSRGFSELGRFVFNSTLGVGGIFDDGRRPRGSIRGLRADSRGLGRPGRALRNDPVHGAFHAA